MLTRTFQLLVLTFLVNNAVLAESNTESPQTSENNSEVVQTATVKIVNGQVVGEKDIRFIQGNRAEITWSSDTLMTIHLHGYDIEQRIQPGEDAAMAFDLFATGRFAVTVHGHSHSSGKKEQTLVYVEVYPR